MSSTCAACGLDSETIMMLLHENAELRSRLDASIAPPLRSVVLPGDIERAIAAKCDCGQGSIHTSSCRVSIEGVRVQIVVRGRS